MPRLRELTIETAAPEVREVMRQQEARFSTVLNPTRLMGYCPTILKGSAALTMGIEQAGNIDLKLRSLIYTYVAGLNGCPF